MPATSHGTSNNLLGSICLRHLHLCMKECIIVGYFLCSRAYVYGSDKLFCCCLATSSLCAANEACSSMCCTHTENQTRLRTTGNRQRERERKIEIYLYSNYSTCQSRSTPPPIRKEHEIARTNSTPFKYLCMCVRADVERRDQRKKKFMETLFAAARTCSWNSHFVSIIL